MHKIKDFVAAALKDRPRMAGTLSEVECKAFAAC
jgi:hypothetical protein